MTTSPQVVPPLVLRAYYLLVADILFPGCQDGQELADGLCCERFWFRLLDQPCERVTPGHGATPLPSFARLWQELQDEFECGVWQKTEERLTCAQGCAKSSSLSFGQGRWHLYAKRAAASAWIATRTDSSSSLKPLAPNKTSELLTPYTPCVRGFCFLCTSKKRPRNEIVFWSG